MLFQASGSRYSLAGALKHLFLVGGHRDNEQLKQLLTLRYSAEEVFLYHKGRSALAEAVRLATGGSGAVVVNGLTCYSLVQAVEAGGARVIYADIDETSLNFSADHLEKLVAQNKDIKAVIVQNMLGIPADIAGIERIAREQNLVIIEDLAHSAGANYADGREVGTVGDLTMLSSGKDKAIDSVNGGALIVRSERFVGQTEEPSDKVSFKNQLRDRFYPVLAWKTRVLYRLGVGKYFMSALVRLKIVVRSADGGVEADKSLPNWQAKNALKQLIKLDETVSWRRQITQKYLSKLTDTVPIEAKQQGASLIRLPLIVKNPQQIIDQLAEQKIFLAGTWYDVPVSPIRYYSLAKFPEKNCPVATRIAKQLINLPTHTKVNDRHIEIITRTIREVER